MPEKVPSEQFCSMFVEDSSIWTTGDYVFTKFEDGKDRFFALATDRILEMTVNQFRELSVGRFDFQLC